MRYYIVIPLPIKNIHFNGCKLERKSYMIIRQLNKEKYNWFQSQIIKKAQQNPLEASYNVNIMVNNTEYCVRFQPEKGYRVAVLQALIVYRDKYEIVHELITDDKMLLSLSEIMIRQDVM